MIALSENLACLDEYRFRLDSLGTLPLNPTSLSELVALNTPIRILLADDHSLVRAGVRALLERLAGVVAQCSKAQSQRCPVIDVLDSQTKTEELN